MLEQAVTNKYVLYHAECTIPTYQSNLRASSISYTVEPRYCEHNAVCRDYRGVRISEVSGRRGNAYSCCWVLRRRVLELPLARNTAVCMCSNLTSESLFVSVSFWSGVVSIGPELCFCQQEPHTYITLPTEIPLLAWLLKELIWLINAAVCNISTWPCSQCHDSLLQRPQAAVHPKFLVSQSTPSAKPGVAYETSILQI